MTNQEKNINTEINSAAAYLQLSISPPQEIFSSGGGEYSRKYHKNPRKKRTKLIRFDNPIGFDSGSTSSISGVVSVKAPKYGGKKPDPSAPKITRPCTECGKKFWSWKALFGHMRCHPERQWRGINPPSNFRRPEGNGCVVETEWTQEDHEVAACLLMLANSPSSFETKGLDLISISAVNHGNLEPDSVVVKDTTAQGGGCINSNADCVFECSSCKKVFGSHQALGGHRATHKNVKGCFAITRNDGEEGLVLEDNNGGEDHVDCGRREALGEGMVLGGHKCSICSRVFTSGQALGGHKRCHWEKGDDDYEPSLSLTPQWLINVNPFCGSRETCGLDLNLPAPVELDSTSGLALDLRLGL